jgi:osmotically-inducible protein OsmY
MTQIKLRTISGMRRTRCLALRLRNVNTRISGRRRLNGTGRAAARIDSRSTPVKTDQQLKTDINAELAWDPAVETARIGVAVNNGVVTLSGQVETFPQKRSLERAVRRVAGVRGVALDLDVRLSPRHGRSDTDIAYAAVNALAWHSLVPEGKVKPQVDGGWVTLIGEVDWAYQSVSAEHCIRPLIGVKGIRNQITVKQHANPADIRHGISAAFARHARREARDLSVDVDGSVVTLSGRVESMAEHDAAIGTARSAKGVSRVVDRIEVLA